MEFINPFAPSRREILLSDATSMNTDTTKALARLSRRPSARDNFSYPRLSRHESNESQSSDGSVPGMTDVSDSDVSFDDDGIYNTSAGELWDSFWPNNTATSTPRKPQDDHLSLLRPRRHAGNSDIDLAKRQQQPDVDGDAVRITSRDHNTKVDELTTPRHKFQSPRLQSTPKRSAVAYSVYPKVPTISVQRHLHPPRTSSLAFEQPPPPPPPPPQRSLFLRSSRSSAALKPSKSSHNIHHLFISSSFGSSSKTASSQQQSTATAKTAVSVPVSPLYPPPPPPKTLRPSTSAFSLRDKARMHSNKVLVPPKATAPLVPLLPSPLPEPAPTRPQLERFVSVFDFDSDSESEADVEEGTSFAKRIARGLHKKTGSEKRGVAERKAVTAGATALDPENSAKDLRERPRNGGSLSRKRGGSLGRIFGLMGR